MSAHQIVLVKALSSLEMRCKRLRIAEIDVLDPNPQPGVDRRRSSSIFVWERPS
jgi:hypothetical protein